MPFITRADGVHFVIPSYRDMLAMKSASSFKKDIQELSQSYGEYITLQQKGPVQFEVAFSPDTGYLLGESIWHHFKRPLDMIYCEAIPNTREAILVIVQSGSVYLDGSFPIDSIQDELIIFLTQKNNFDIYTYGDVPISPEPEEGKFSFEKGSVRAFTKLDEPVFPTLALVGSYQLQLVDTVLQEHRIGVLPVRKMVVGGVIAVLLYVMWSYMTAPEEEQQALIISGIPSSPSQAYYKALDTPAPDDEVAEFLAGLSRLFAMPGWKIKDVIYSGGDITASVGSGGSNIGTLQDWADRNHAKLDATTKGINVILPVKVRKRPAIVNIYQIKEVLIAYLDKLALIYPGDHVKVNSPKKKQNFLMAKIEISVDKLSPIAIGLIGQSFKNQPFVLDEISLKQSDKGLLSGQITIQIVGS